MREERRSAASRPQRSHRSTVCARPLPGCSRRCSRRRRYRARWQGRWRAGRNAHAENAVRRNVVATRTTHLIIIEGLRPGRREQQRHSSDLRRGARFLWPAVRQSLGAGPPPTSTSGPVLGACLDGLRLAGRR